MHITTEDGQFVSEKHERLARVIQDYDPAFALAWIPPKDRRDPEDITKCYAVIEVDTGLPVFYAGELDEPATILAKLFDADNKHGNVLDRIEAHNAAVEALRMKEKMDLAEERKDYIAWLIGTNKNFINMGNGRVVDDQLRTVRRGNKR